MKAQEKMCKLTGCKKGIVLRYEGSALPQSSRRVGGESCYQGGVAYFLSLAAFYTRKLRGTHKLPGEMGCESAVHGPKLSSQPGWRIISKPLRKTTKWESEAAGDD